MHKKRMIVSMVFSCLVSVHVLATSYQLPIISGGQKRTRLAIDDWMGEYPAPVINVHAKQKGWTTIKAVRSIRGPNKKIACTIKNGLYHPWSKTPNSIVNYYTFTDLLVYKAVKKTKLEGVTIAKGTVIDNVHPLSEGYYSGRLRLGKKKKTIEFFFDKIDKGDFKKVSGNEDYYKQWLYLNCKEGYKAFVEDDDLLKQKGITLGKIKTYGKVDF